MLKNSVNQCIKSISFMPLLSKVMAMNTLISQYLLVFSCTVCSVSMIITRSLLIRIYILYITINPMFKWTINLNYVQTQPQWHIEQFHVSGSVIFTPMTSSQFYQRLFSECCGDNRLSLSADSAALCRSCYKKKRLTYSLAEKNWRIVAKSFSKESKSWNLLSSPLSASSNNTQPHSLRLFTLLLWPNILRYIQYTIC